MAGGTKSYSIWRDPLDQPEKLLVSFHPKFAMKVSDAVLAVLERRPAHLAPPDWLAFETAYFAALPAHLELERKNKVEALPEEGTDGEV